MPNQDDLADLILAALARRAAGGLPPEPAPRSDGSKRKDDPHNPRYVDEHEAARQLLRNVQTLRSARTGRGPLAKALPWHKVAGRIMYAQRDLDRLIEGGRVDKSEA